MRPYIPVPEPITPEWLNSVLPGGDVQAVTAERNAAFNSETRHLRLQYAPGAAAGLPERLLLKQSGPTAWMVEAGAAEVAFYRLVAALEPAPPAIVPCYAAAADAASGGSYVLLQDLSASHHPPMTRDEQLAMDESVPSAVDIERVVDTLARHHAYWWEHPQLASDLFAVGYWSRSAERFAAYLERRRRAWDSLKADESDWFPADLLALYEHVFAQLERHWRRYLEPRFRNRQQLTLIHGDAYFANFLCPRPGTEGATYLVDWQEPTVDLAGYDLVNLIAAYWMPERRGRDGLELRMLRRYHATLAAGGVRDYTWDDLSRDYRSGLIFWLLMPLQDRLDGAALAYWWPKLQCTAAAFREWRCGELLEAE